MAQDNCDGMAGFTNAALADYAVEIQFFRPKLTPGIQRVFGPLAEVGRANLTALAAIHCTALRSANRLLGLATVNKKAATRAAFSVF